MALVGKIFCCQEVGYGLVSRRVPTHRIHATGIFSY